MDNNALRRTSRAARRGALMGLIVEGKMKPVIDEVLPLERAAEGLRLIENREVFGKVIIKP